MNAKLVDPVDYRDEIDKKWISEGLLEMMREILTEQEYIVIVSRFLLEIPNSHIAKTYKVCLARIHQIKLKALRKLRGRRAYDWMVRFNIPEAENSIWHRDKEEISDFTILSKSKVRNVTSSSTEKSHREKSISTSSWDEYQRVILAKIVLGEVKPENVHF